MSLEEKLTSMGISLPKPMEPLANYVTAVIDGVWSYTSGMGPIENGKP